MNVSKDVLARLQSRQERIRNVCVLAHVDHGKTTLSDSLIASNGIISGRLVGEMRYLDSRDDEQARGITMKSSSISLVHVPRGEAGGGAGAATAAEQLQRGYLVNLIDSPGHVDFCSEVSTAVRLCDGALVVVDAAEGVRIQTHAVLKQARAERVAPCLVINKIDRLATELGLDAAAAHERLALIVDEANAVLAALASAEFLAQADDAAEAADLEWYEGDGSDDEDVFKPSKGNVLFCSAADGWGFTVPQFAGMYAQKFGFSQGALARALWGPYAFRPKDRTIAHMSKAGAKAKPMFVRFVLEPLWAAYEATHDWADASEVLGRVVRSQGLDVPEKAYASPGKASVQAVMRAWLPLAEATLSMVAHHLPSPITAATARVPHLTRAAALPPDALAALPAAARATLARGRVALAASDASATAPVVIYISKMIAVPAGAVPRLPGEAPPADAHAEEFLAFGRVFSGVVREGMRVQVLSAAYTPLRPDQHRQHASVTGVYLMMGRALERLQAVPAGNVLALRGLADAILKSATVCSGPAAFPLAAVQHQAEAIVQVAIEPALPHQLPQLEAGLRLLNRADPFVRVSLAEDSGEWLLGAAGEIHLETCVKDLCERFARVELAVSPPLVGFKESVVHPAEVPDGSAAAAPPSKEQLASVVETRAAGGLLRVRARAAPLPAEAAGALEEHAALVDALQRMPVDTELEAGLQAQVDELHERLAAGADAAKDHSLHMLRRTWMLGPKRKGPNILAWRDPSDAERPSFFRDPTLRVVHAGATERRLFGDDGAEASEAADSSGDEAEIGSCAAAAALRLRPAAPADARPASPVLQSIEAGVSAGFQMATSAGPLCADALWGVALELEIALATDDETFDVHDADAWAGLDFREAAHGPLSGQVMAAVASAARRAVELAGARLVEAYYLVQVATSTMGLDAAATIIKARRGRILSNEAREGQDLFIITAHVPVEACLSKRGAAGGGEGGGAAAAKRAGRQLSFADDLRREASGAASASLAMSHWERLQVDPSWKPTSEEEREEHGEEGALMKNLARQLANVARLRKGLPQIGGKVVGDGTKQRTRARKV